VGFTILAETCNLIQDHSRGRTDEALLLTGKDDFILKRGELGLLFVPYDEHGSPVNVRVGRYTSTVIEIIRMFSEKLYIYLVIRQLWPVI